MEKFIRDKYERKRFITVENGGLGGAESDRAPRKAPLPSNVGMNSTPQSSLGRRPVQMYQTYDEPGANVRKGAVPLSYGGMFRSSAPPAPTPTWMSTRLSTGNYNAMTESQANLSRPRNAIQRASTVREIMNMGFPAELAARAAEAAQGDLQRAVEWVLANSPDAHQPPASKPPQQDLLDFGEPTPAAMTNGVHGVDMNASTAKGSETATPPAAVREDFADFADFGAFESALPTVIPAATVQTTSSRGAGISLSGSLAGLYAHKSEQRVTSQQQGTGNARSHGSFVRSSGLQRSPQHTPLSSTGNTQAGRYESVTKKGNQQVVQPGYSYGSSQAAPHPAVEGSQAASFSNMQMQSGYGVVPRPGMAQGSPRGGTVLTRPQSYVANTGTAHSPVTQTGRFGNTQSLPQPNALSASVLTQLPGAGAVRLGESVQMRRPSLTASSERKKKSDEIPSFTWPAEVKSTRALTKETNSFPAASTKNDEGATAGVGATINPSSPPPPPPPPQELSITGSDVPPPPEDPPKSETEMLVSAIPGAPPVNTKIQQAPEESKAPQKDEAVTESSAPQEGQDEDPFAALSLLAMSAATSKMKGKSKQPVKATLVDRAEKESNGPSMSSTNNFTGVDLDNLLG